MARADLTIEMKDTRRPCIFQGKNGSEKAFFHCWSHEREVVAPSIMRGGHNGGTVSTTAAILEFEDGTVGKYSAHSFKFIDGGGFSDIAWPDIVKEKDDAQN